MLVLLGLVLFAWWAQRDAYRIGVETGRLQERAVQHTRELAARREHLRVIK